MKQFLLVCALFIGTGPYLTAQHMVISLWPDGAPGVQTGPGSEMDATKPSDGTTGGKTVIRLTNVTSPTVTIYRAPEEKDTGAAVVVFPGGGYRILAMDLEGTEICEWLNRIGVTAALVKYRVPERPGVPRYSAPLQDAQRALGIVRSHAADWRLDSNRIGVLGFSAGGHLLATLNSNFAQRTYRHVDNADDASCRPDFTLLIYPAYLSVEDKGQEIAPEAQPIPGTPPLFIVQAEDDTAFIQGTLLYYRALIAAKVPAELHVYEKGGHGYGLRPTNAPVTGWPRLAEAWLRLHEFIR